MSPVNLAMHCQMMNFLAHTFTSMQSREDKNNNIKTIIWTYCSLSWIKTFHYRRKHFSVNMSNLIMVCSKYKIDAKIQLPWKHGCKLRTAPTICHSWDKATIGIGGGLALRKKQCSIQFHITLCIYIMYINKCLQSVKRNTNHWTSSCWNRKKG